MSRFAKSFAANAIAAAGPIIAGLGAALALSATASAEPVLPPAVPDVPALSAIQQLATNPAGMGAILQSAASALNGASQVISPSQTLPVSPIDVTGTAPLAPALSPALSPAMSPALSPALAPAAAVPTPASALLGPASGLVPLLNQMGIPANLINLPPAATPVAPAAVAPLAPLAPIAAAPAVAPLAPAAAAVPLLPAGGLLNALP